MKKKMKEKKVVGKNQPKSAAKVADKGTVKKSKKEVSVDTEKVSKDAKIMESKSAIRKARKEDKKKETQLGDPVEVKNLISTLSQAAMLVKLEVSAWRGTGSDKEVAAVLAGQFNGSVDGFSSRGRCQQHHLSSGITGHHDVDDILLGRGSVALSTGAFLHEGCGTQMR